MRTREPVPFDAVETVAAESVAERRCGRCQRHYAGDPTLAFQTEWSLCPACAEVLLPRSGRRSS